MRRRLYLDIVLPLSLLAIATAIISLKGWDLKVASRFYTPGAGWTYSDLQPWDFLYEHGPKIPAAAAIIAAVVLAAGFRWPTYRKFRRGAIFTILFLAIGPGLIVNPILKDHWGRPRPRQVAEFGGSMSFHEVWQPGPAGKGKSFPCGHASGAFFFIAPYFLLRRRHRTAAVLSLAGGLAFGAVMGTARILQGGHFLSDVIWSAGIVYIVGAILAYLLRVDEEAAAAT